MDASCVLIAQRSTACANGVGKAESSAEKGSKPSRWESDQCPNY
jgi:hypothetical protein